MTLLCQSGVNVALSLQTAGFISPGQPMTFYEHALLEFVCYEDVGVGL